VFDSQGEESAKVQGPHIQPLQPVRTLEGVHKKIWDLPYMLQGIGAGWKDTRRREGKLVAAVVF
jgi:hypothetical protein